MPTTEAKTAEVENTSDHTVEVVAGVIWHPDNSSRVLLALRKPGQHQGGLWEFPGGKIDPGETGLQALERELKEEVAIMVTQAESWLSISHDYTDKSVNLHFWHVNRFNGTPQGCEQQQLRWVSLAELGDYAFPEANQPVVDRLLSGSDSWKENKN